jgi:hypothetical protein
MTNHKCWYCECEYNYGFVKADGVNWHTKCREDYLRVRRFFEAEKPLKYYQQTPTKTIGETTSEFKQILQNISKL